ncbi:MAG: 6-phosphogluconolactonase [Deltaproteobacteria bacterium]|nr:6-phosphogluconolactonase [Deltaproteobacteria bacterium]
MNMHIVSDLDALAFEAAELFASQAEVSIQERGRFMVALAGGVTPSAAYRLLANQSAPYYKRIAWEKVHIFFGDERFVPAAHHDSNYRMATETLLSHVPIPKSNIHRIVTEYDNADLAAQAYARELGMAFGLTPPGMPRFDLVLLGMSSDGGTASIFPGENTVGEWRTWVAAPFVVKLGAYRLTLTFPVFDNARYVAFLVSGQKKATALARILGTPGHAWLPAGQVRPQGKLLWIIDRDAAAELPTRIANAGS